MTKSTTFHLIKFRLAVPTQTLHVWVEIGAVTLYWIWSGWYFIEQNWYGEKYTIKSPVLTDERFSPASLTTEIWALGKFLQRIGGGHVLQYVAFSFSLYIAPKIHVHHLALAKWPLINLIVAKIDLTLRFDDYDRQSIGLITDSVCS